MSSAFIPFSATDQTSFKSKCWSHRTAKHHLLVASRVQYNREIIDLYLEMAQFVITGIISSHFHYDRLLKPLDQTSAAGTRGVGQGQRGISPRR